MKLATYSTGDAGKIGALMADGRRLVDLQAAAGSDPRFATMLSLIDAGDAGLAEARALLSDAERTGAHCDPLDTVTLLAPIPVPPQIRDFSVFPAHIVQAPTGMKKLAAALSGEPIPEIEPGDVPAVYKAQPIYYFTNRFSVVGPETTVTWPRYSTYMDFEIELAVVLGKGGKDISVEAAGGHIFGYTIFNDFSARDAQLVEMGGMLGPAKGKSFHAGNAMGPFLVTRDEIPDVGALKASVRINGQPFMADDCSAMLHSFEEMIAFVSRDETLHAGEIFGSGTVGNGCGLEHFTFLADGDVVELEIDAIGVLRNTVVRQ